MHLGNVRSGTGSRGGGHTGRGEGKAGGVGGGGERGRGNTDDQTDAAEDCINLYITIHNRFQKMGF